MHVPGAPHFHITLSMIRHRRIRPTVEHADHHIMRLPLLTCNIHVMVQVIFDVGIL